MPKAFAPLDPVIAPELRPHKEIPYALFQRDIPDGGQKFNLLPAQIQNIDKLEVIGLADIVHFGRRKQFRHARKGDSVPVLVEILVGQIDMVVLLHAFETSLDNWLLAGIEAVQINQLFGQRPARRLCPAGDRNCRAFSAYRESMSRMGIIGAQPGKVL